MQQDEDNEPKFVEECRLRNNCQKWKDAIQIKLSFLEKCEVFGPIIYTLKSTHPVGYKWIFVRKNRKNKVIICKARLVTQGSQRPGIDNMKTYSHLVDAISYKYLINMTVHKSMAGI